MNVLRRWEDLSGPAREMFDELVISYPEVAKLGLEFVVSDTKNGTPFAREAA
jgi:hypothetical protein